jgi:hypothetical protein
MRGEGEEGKRVRGRNLEFLHHLSCFVLSRRPECEIMSPLEPELELALGTGIGIGIGIGIGTGIGSGTGTAM